MYYFGTFVNTERSKRDRGSVAPVTLGNPRNLRGARVCLIVDVEDLDIHDSFIHGFSTLAQGLTTEFAELVVLVVAPEGSFVDTNQILHTLTIQPDESEEATRKIRVERLPPLDVPMDASHSVASGYKVLEWAKEASPQFTALHFLSPYLAHYSTLARLQGLALLRTPILVHFLNTVEMRVNELRARVIDVEQLEREHMEAAVSLNADALVLDSSTIQAYVESLQRAHLVVDRVTGSRGGAPAGGPTLPVLTLPLPASTMATRYAHAGGILHRQCSKEFRCVLSIIVFWAPLDSSGGLERFCDAIDELLELLEDEEKGGDDE
eukprot:CAMPEP_0196577806 /NCGR_PEP_ID=MMETSP1081-20130531/6816_1 /TAXON_ID=36882 /ORGANISM="Pyramimonas amylifera, Strain CCMP720" /LENGTH=321 /DNA_ID=CAMNT_0041896829 /DNA_START=212 /DNA_END=1174 /DNA_ORIENTATION=+